MNKIFFTVILITCLTGSAIAQSSLGLVAHWPFNGNANDVTGKGHNGTLHGNVTPAAGKGGSSGTAFLFPGDSSSYITVPFQNDLNLDSFSICAMLKVNGFFTSPCQVSFILSRGSDQTTGHYHLALTDYPFDSSCVETGDTSFFVFQGGAWANNCAQKPQQYTPTTRTNKWYSIVATFNGIYYKLYVNGTLMSTAYPSSAAPIGTSTKGITIGKLPDLPLYPYWFKGVIDDLRLYNRPLSAVEVKEYNTVNDVDENNIQLNLFPNPSKGSFTIQGVTHSNQPVDIEVCNQLGQIIYKDFAHSFNGQLNTKIHLPTLISDGVYFVKVKTDTSCKVIQLNIQQ